MTVAFFFVAHLIAFICLVADRTAWCVAWAIAPWIVYYLN